MKKFEKVMTNWTKMNCESSKTVGKIYETGTFVVLQAPVVAISAGVKIVETAGKGITDVVKFAKNAVKKPAKKAKDKVEIIEYEIVDPEDYSEYGINWNYD
jgi:nicotinic acid phosphoribosyltransferase